MLLIILKGIEGKGDDIPKRKSKNISRRLYGADEKLYR